ncbi:Ig-like V-type domain-containing protein FAM187A [Sebastes umbrosus]|uniref:Ig-like V-type domain-containing protein FAM187A n=1 Tax=Sebastes umbrosus TaxID=72105 RepID=UPI00189D6025|nr:Ig-like V-type domain-containing protein FAM187A [Sebastes umbrosus]
MPPASSSPILLLLLFLLGCPEVWSYEAPEDRQDVFARRACPAFLTFTNAAYLSGVTLELPCHCKPSQIQSVVWFFRKHLGGSEVTRALTDYHGNRLLDPRHVPHSGDLRSRFSIRLFSLLIFRAGPDDSGIYICGSVHRDFFHAYDVDIQEARLSRFIPRVKQRSRKGPGSAQSSACDLCDQMRRNRVKQRTNTRQTGRNIEAPYRAWSVCRRCDRDRNERPEPLFQTFIGFQPWPVCDRCGVPGEQVRPGICYVDSRYLHPRYRLSNQSIASCGSGAVPWTLKQLKLRGSIGRLEVRSCQVTCQSQPPPSSSLRDLMAFLGYSSASRPVFHLSHPADRVLTLGCPGAQPNSAVAWDRGSQPIYRSQRWAGRDPDAAPIRLVVDSGNHLVFKPAKTEDSGVYYCWLNGHRAAEIRLLVYAHLGRGQSVTSHPDFPAALNTVLGGYAVMTAVFCLLVIGRAGVRLLRETHND